MEPSSNGIQPKFNVQTIHLNLSSNDFVGQTESLRIGISSISEKILKQYLDNPNNTESVLKIVFKDKKIQFFKKRDLELAAFKQLIIDTPVAKSAGQITLKPESPFAQQKIKFLINLFQPKIFESLVIKLTEKKLSQLPAIKLDAAALQEIRSEAEKSPEFKKLSKKEFAKHLSNLEEQKQKQLQEVAHKNASYAAEHAIKTQLNEFSKSHGSFYDCLLLICEQNPDVKNVLTNVLQTLIGDRYDLIREDSPQHQEIFGSSQQFSFTGKKNVPRIPASEFLLLDGLEFMRGHLKKTSDVENYFQNALTISELLPEVKLLVDLQAIAKQFSDKLKSTTTLDQMDRFEERLVLEEKRLDEMDEKEFSQNVKELKVCTRACIHNTRVEIHKKRQLLENAMKSSMESQTKEDDPSIHSQKKIPAVLMVFDKDGKEIKITTLLEFKNAILSPKGRLFQLSNENDKIFFNKALQHVLNGDFANQTIHFTSEETEALKKISAEFNAMAKFLEDVSGNRKESAANKFINLYNDKAQQNLERIEKGFQLQEIPALIYNMLKKQGDDRLNEFSTVRQFQANYIRLLDALRPQQASLMQKQRHAIDKTLQTLDQLCKTAEQLKIVEEETKKIKLAAGGKTMHAKKTSQQPIPNEMSKKIEEQQQVVNSRVTITRAAQQANLMSAAEEKAVRVLLDDLLTLSEELGALTKPSEKLDKYQALTVKLEEFIKQIGNAFNLPKPIKELLQKDLTTLLSRVSKDLFSISITKTVSDPNDIAIERLENNLLIRLGTIFNDLSS